MSYVNLKIPSDFRFSEEKIQLLDIGETGEQYEIAFKKNKRCSVSDRNPGVDGTEICKNCYYREFEDKLNDVRKSKRKEFLEYQLELREDKLKWLDELDELLTDNEDIHYSFCSDFKEIIRELRNNLTEDDTSNESYSFVDSFHGLLSSSIAESLKDQIPRDISHCAEKFKSDYPEGIKTAFVIMKFTETDIHEEILLTIKDVLSQYDIIALRADDKEYSDDLFANIKTYMHCCDFGIAIFERITEDDFNPNVSLEVGYMMGLNKPICLLKDQTLKNLHTDLAGKLYKPFNTHKIKDTLSKSLLKWLKDREIIES